MCIKSNLNHHINGIHHLPPPNSRPPKNVSNFWPVSGELLESCVYCLFIGPGSRSWRRSEQVRPYGLCIFIIPYLWTRPKYITKGILSSCSSLQLLMDLLIAGKILLFFSQRLMDLLKLIMYIALTHSTAFLTSPHCKNSKNRSCVQITNLI